MPRFRSCKNETGNSNPPGAHLRHNRLAHQKTLTPSGAEHGLEGVFLSEKRTTELTNK